MGLSGISPGSLLLILLIAMILFGTKRLQNIGEDLGRAFKSFRKAMSEDDSTNFKQHNNNLESKDSSKE